MKLFRREFKISLQSYPTFFEKPHPELQKSLVIDLSTGKMKGYEHTETDNPPILHRKELLLPTDHDQRGLFEQLTRREEQYGLLKESAMIGFKVSWQRILREKGLSYRGHRLVRMWRVDKSARDPTVKRHRTAISKHILSKPVQTLLEHGLLSRKTSFFDYGFGQGDDLRILKEMGIEGNVWDPAYRPEAQKRTSDVVNLGSVLNVIKDPVERMRALRDSFSLGAKVLAVSVITPNAQNEQNWRSCGDGILTGRSTFQKYFGQEELRQYVEDALASPSVAVALGIFYVFKYPSDMQEFLAKKIKRTINWDTISHRIWPKRISENTRLKYIEHKEILDDFWRFMLELERLPKRDEYRRYREISRRIGSARKPRDLFIALHGRKPIDQAYSRCRDD